MTRRAHRSAQDRPLTDGPAPFTTLVELTFDRGKVERWIRFGRKSYEQIIDRRRSVVGFAPKSIFAFVRWASGDHGTVVYRVHYSDADGPEVGAAWQRTGEKAGDYLSVLLDDPALPQPIRANLFQNDDDETSWSLHWNRQKLRDGRE